MRRAPLFVALLALALAAAGTEPPPGVPPGTMPVHKSINQLEWESHLAMAPLEQPSYPLTYVVKPEAQGGCALEVTPQSLTKTVYGFMPYWVVSDLSHVHWNLLTHVAYFSMGVNSDGSLTNQSGSYAWPSGSYAQALIATAHANGVKVTLAATLFNSASIAALLGSSTSRQNAVNNLLSAVQAGGADGVNIDFEGVPSAQKANLVTFMTALSAAFHSAIAGSHVSLDTPAVDWSGAFDYDQLALNCDGLFIMGYDYYWSGSSTAGPCAPLAGSARWGTYSVTWTVNDYLTYGGAANASKFILGVPYYGYQWPTSSATVPSATTGNGTSKTYDAAGASAVTYGRQWDSYGSVPYYVNSSGPYQCFYDDAQSLGLKWDLVNSQGLGGTGIWALNYDTSNASLWDALSSKFQTASGDLTGVKIGVDPGHGGTDSGAVGPTGLQEKDVNLATSLLLRDALQARGASVYMTRTTDVTVSLTARTDYFNSIPVDRSESCHYNACGNCGANYTGVHVYDDGTNTCPASATSKDMAAKTALRLDAALSIGVVSTNCGIYGVHGDNFAMVRDTSMPAMLTEASFIDNAAEEQLLYTVARRCLIAGAIAKGIEDHYSVTAADPPCAAPSPGTCANPIAISSLPYTDSNTTVGKQANMDNYSCGITSGSEAGPEVVYQVALDSPGTLSASLTGTTGDPDVYLLSSCNPAACITRGDSSLSALLQPGAYTIVVDTWTSSTGTQYPGQYTLTVAFSPQPGDTTSPSPVQNLKWNASLGQWEWDAVTTDRLGNAETMGHYEVWTAQNPLAAFTCIAPEVTSNAYPDPSVPTAGTCTYYYIHAVDAAGNRDLGDPMIADNPSAVFAGSWLTGTSQPGHYGSDYRYVATGGSGANTATWNFWPRRNGTYEVALYYPAASNRSTESRFTVASEAGSQLFAVNQQINGGAWFPVAAFPFASGQSYSVVLDDAEPAGYYAVADAVMWSPSADAIADNPQASFTGSWSTGTTTPGHYGADYRFISTGGTGANTAVWSFTPEESGSYNIYVFYPSGTNRSSAARFTVAHAGGTALYTVNQQANGGSWVLLGKRWLEAHHGYAVTLDDAEPSGFVVIADAVKWEKAP